MKRDKGLGRVISPDIRNLNYLIRGSGVVKPAPRTGKKYHNANGWWGDQGSTPHCVGFAFAHMIEDGPITHKGTAPIVDPVDIYMGAQANDQWSGTDYDGTSALGACKWLKNKGVIGDYLWGHTLEELINSVFVQPVPMGISWYSDMFEPNSHGFVTPTGDFAGGHEILVNGVNVDANIFRIKNSWGRSWGDNGHFWVTFETMHALILDYADMVFVTEFK